jgi:Periplasmic binding protein
LAASSAIAGPSVLRAQNAAFKLGLLTVKTGPLAQGGIQMEQGAITYLKEKNFTLAGRKVEFFSADTGGNPAGARTKAQELIERDAVDVILGPLAAFELLAITDYIREQKTPMLSLAAADDLTQRRPNPYFLRASATSSQAMHPMGVVEAGLAKTGGRSDDKNAFMVALKSVALTDTPRGPIRFDHLGNVIGNFYIQSTHATILRWRSADAHIFPRLEKCLLLARSRLSESILRSPPSRQSRQHLLRVISSAFDPIRTCTRSILMISDLRATGAGNGPRETLR